MKYDDKFMEVLVQVVKELIGPENKDVTVVEKQIVEDLIKKGYELEEISDILEEIFEATNSEYQKEFKIRLVNPKEVQSLTDEAKKYFFELKRTGFIEEEIFEEILNDFNKSFMRVDLKALKKMLEEKGVRMRQLIN